MRRANRFLLSVLVALLVAAIPVPVFAYQEEGASGSWIQSDGDWWYRYESGTYPHADISGSYEIVQIDGVRYAFDASGWMGTGWILDSGSWMYADSTGSLVSDGWDQIEGSWYLFDSTGKMLTGWQLLGGSWYWLDPSSGAMATGWLDLDGTWYYLGASGAMLTAPPGPCSPGGSRSAACGTTSTAPGQC